MAPWSGSAPNESFSRSDGTYTGATTHQQNQAGGGSMTAAMWDTHNQDVATALNLALKKDGGNKPTANIDAGGFGLTNASIYGFATEASVASSGTCNVLGATSVAVAVTGNTGPITSFGTGTNRWRFVRFASTPTITHNATSLILPTGADITAAAGDTALLVSDASSNVRVVMYQRATGAALTGSGYAPGGTDVALADGGTGASLADPGADRILFWDDSETSAAWLTPGTGLAISTTSIAVDIGLQTIWVPAAAMVARTTNGAAAGSTETGTNDIMLVSKDFDTTTSEGVQFSIQMPESWNEGTISFAPVWSHPSTMTNFGVVFAMRAVALANDDAADSAFGTEQTSTDTGGTTDDIYIGPTSAAITVAGTPGAGEWVVFEVKRNVADGSDTLGVDARLHGVKLLYTIASLKDAS